MGREKWLSDRETSEDLSQAAQMVEMLRSSGNPKFQNSQFVSFVDKISKGDLKFENDTVVGADGQEIDWDALYDTTDYSAGNKTQEEIEKMGAEAVKDHVNGESLTVT